MPEEVFFTSIQRFLILVENSNVDDAIGRQLMQQLWGKVPELKMVRRRSEDLQGVRSMIAGLKCTIHMCPWVSMSL